jgi:hypothetical protein
MRLCLLLLLGCGSSPDCRIEAVLDDLIDGQQLGDCGTLQPSQAESSFRAAHDCVLTNDAARTPYVVFWNIQGIDSRVASAYVGLSGASGWQTRLLRYDGDPGGGGGDNHPLTTTRSCTAVTDRANCSDLRYSLCVTCEGETTVETCRGP